MKKFRITLNGVSYDLEVTELDAGSASAPVSAPAPAAPVVAAAPAPAATPAPTPAVAPKAAAGGTTVTAPMNGVILSVNGKVGDKVGSRDAVVILEAMKMENEIFAGVDGVIASIEVRTGDSVQPGDVLFTIG